MLKRFSVYFEDSYISVYVFMCFWILLCVPAAVQTVPGVADVAAAAPGAEAVPDPGAATTTAAPGPAPTPDPGQGPGPSRSRSPEPPGGASQSLPPDLGPAPGLSQGVEPHLPTEGPSPSPGPDPNPRAGLNLQRTTEQSLNPKLDTIQRYTGEWGGLHYFNIMCEISISHHLANQVSWIMNSNEKANIGTDLVYSEGAVCALTGLYVQLM